MRFVSSGVYFGLLSGLIINLSRGVSLSELHASRERETDDAPPQAGPSFWEVASDFLRWPARLAAWGGLGWLCWRLLTQFNELQGPLFRMTLSGEILQWWIAWACFLFCVASQCFIFARVALLARNALVPLLVLLILWPLNLSWGFFRADVHHNIAIFFSKRQEWEQAVKNYLIVGRLNPAFVMSYYFKGNVFNDRFNMTKLHNPNWGDPEGVERDDFDRALSAYGEVRAKAPNYVQMHHQMGVLHLKRAEWENSQGRPAEAERYLDEALKYFRMYRNIDPVFPPNYLRMGQIYMMRKQYDKAAETYRALVEADECEVAGSLLSRPWLRESLLGYQSYSDYDGRLRHVHETPEAYLHLGNAYFMLEKLSEAEKAYKSVLRLDPTNENATRNLQVVYGKAQTLGRLKVHPPSPGSKGAPVLELLPPR